MVIRVDVARCVGAGQCVLAAPEVFDQNDDDGVVVLLDDSPPVESRERVLVAMERCPAQVITVQDDPSFDEPP
jgi:ferredoxin